ncbi:hypothetical protein CY34DRAFT_19493 [Suillus luteus UH-Slu-Lm8-n1]|uniref:Uncharacterized protein n=1 Tax=Suillus luteus UH-Slu-Lm8-n1 TaxID=930992 RepID=A0A0C9ZRB1_9AGAM|nr:hypothetical protein CY34DRAFT_19493 [Suillus luteus UH-Slu-Lm8-n1]
MCSPTFFAEGIKFNNKYLKRVFPTATICIRDAIILAKQRLITHGTQESSFQSACKDYLIEMVTVANHSGRPVELGLKCQQAVTDSANPASDSIKPLNMMSAEIIAIVYGERYKFVKSLKEICIPLADLPRKRNAGGFCLNSFTIETVVPYITQLTGMTVWNDEVTSISFTCCSSGKYYRRMPILKILALRILQPLRMHHQSLLDMFPAQYERLPEHLIANACGMYVICFRRQLPGYPSNQISSEALERESAQQLRLLRTVRQRKGTDARAHELDEWMNTRDGPNGWLQDL